MWSARLRPPSIWRIQAPGRALSSSFTRGRSSPRGPRNSLRRPEPISSNSRADATPPQQPGDSSHPETTNPSSPAYDPVQNTLLSPVHIPEDPNGVLKETHPAANLLANSGLVVQRQLEMMNVMIGFEQANKYTIMDANGNHVGYMAEQEKGMANTMARQWFRTHRSFVTHVFDRHENEVLRFHRPFSWINSCIRVYDPLDIAWSTYSSTALQGVSPDSLIQATAGSHARVSPLGLEEMRVIGEAQQQWAPLRRKYNLFNYHHSPNPATEIETQRLPLSKSGMSEAQQMQLTRASGDAEGMGEFSQFAYVDEPFMSWDFSLRSADGQLIGSVNRDFAGFAREIFTDTGVYALRMDSASLSPGETPAVPINHVPAMTLDQRAVMLATAVTVDFDYFSRHSGSGGFGFMPLWFPGMGGEAAAGGAAAGEAGAAGAAGGAVGEAATGAVGRAGMGGIAEGATAGAAGAGAIAGYDAMHRGMAGDNTQAPPPPMDQQSQAPDDFDPYQNGWPQEREQDPWGQDTRDPWGAEEPSDGGEGGGGDDFDWF